MIWLKELGSQYGGEKKWKGLKTTWFGQKTRHGKGHIFGFKIW
jgi:hypothetical protein